MMFAHDKPKQETESAVPKKEPEKTVSVPNETGIPDGIKTGFETLSGFSLDAVRVHYNSDKPAQLNAFAYAQGNQVYVGPGQEKHLGHELGHIVQQRQGRVSPTAEVDGTLINDDTRLEREADALGQSAARHDPDAAGAYMRFAGVPRGKEVLQGCFGDVAQLKAQCWRVSQDNNVMDPVPIELDSLENLNEKLEPAKYWTRNPNSTVNRMYNHTGEAKAAAAATVGLLFAKTSEGTGVDRMLTYARKDDPETARGAGFTEARLQSEKTRHPDTLEDPTLTKIKRDEMVKAKKETNAAQKKSVSDVLDTYQIVVTARKIAAVSAAAAVEKTYATDNLKNPAEFRREILKAEFTKAIGDKAGVDIAVPKHDQELIDAKKAAKKQKSFTNFKRIVYYEAFTRALNAIFAQISFVGDVDTEKERVAEIAENVVGETVQTKAFGKESEYFKASQEVQRAASNASTGGSLVSTVLGSDEGTPFAVKTIAGTVIDSLRTGNPHRVYSTAEKLDGKKSNTAAVGNYIYFNAVGDGTTEAGTPVIVSHDQDPLSKMKLITVSGSKTPVESEESPPVRHWHAGFVKGSAAAAATKGEQPEYETAGMIDHYFIKPDSFPPQKQEKGTAAETAPPKTQPPAPPKTQPPAPPTTQPPAPVLVPPPVPEPVPTLTVPAIATTPATTPAHHET